MARPLRLEFAGAIYHVMSRGNGRQRILLEERDGQRLLEGLGVTVQRFGWELLAFIFMTNHLHLLLRTPQPNPAKPLTRSRLTPRSRYKNTAWLPAADRFRRSSIHTGGRTGRRSR